MWELSCICGNTTVQEAYSVTSGRVKSCGCWHSEQSRQNGLRNSQANRKFSPMISSAKAVAYNYRNGCDFDTFYRLSQQDCYYCGRAPHRTFNTANTAGKRIVSQEQRDYGNFTYNGLDRLDSSKDHSPDNVVPCCYDCNRAKMAMSVDDFIAHIERIYLHTRKNAIDRIDQISQGCNNR